MSTSSTWSAARTTASGTVSRCGTPVIFSHDVVERLEVLDVDVGDDVDAGVQQFLDVLPALLVPRAGHVRVRELVDQRDLGPAGEDRVEVHLRELGTPVVDRRAWEDLEALQQRRGVRAAVRLDERDHHVRAAFRRRWPSLSMANVLPTPAAAPR